MYLNTKSGNSQIYSDTLKRVPNYHSPANFQLEFLIKTQSCGQLKQLQQVYCTCMYMPTYLGYLAQQYFVLDTSVAILTELILHLPQVQHSTNNEPQTLRGERKSIKTSSIYFIITSTSNFARHRHSSP